ncbi:Beta-hexosaminidase [Aquicella siphonis]|uniref:Beta-hexosaminidase n=1 Tax=Aquicella siphonis TaxID=254247 RepID=A0A5E4PG38_9COXI|nr:beta-N-acetylhexosaminidase [Aquicella siphonis]VVC75889.1 Beta-hexosaminidase [Aquicella siphonis]
MTDKIGSLIIDLEGLQISPEEKDLLNHPVVGGVILFARNYETRAQLTRLCHQIRSARKKPVLIMADQEGGRVQRFVHDFTRLPYMAAFGGIYDQDPATACKMAHDCGWLMAIELLSAGIDQSLAPVLDLNKGVSTVIGRRAFHSKPEYVIKIATAFMNGMHEAGMASTGKHFPGHGSVILDSHVAAPFDDRTIQEIDQDDMIPFAGLIKAGISAIMAAHIVYPKVDKMPVGFSRYWLQDILRQRLGFKGVIFSDDLNMEGANISANCPDRIMAAREAGCDFTLLCNNRKGVIEALDSLSASSQQVSRDKWTALQGDFSGVHVPYNESRRWLAARAVLSKLEADMPGS